MENAMVYMNLVLTFALGMLLAAVVAHLSTARKSVTREVIEHELAAAIRREVRRELERELRHAMLPPLELDQGRELASTSS
jgi:hypothetical protein